MILTPEEEALLLRTKQRAEQLVSLSKEMSDEIDRCSLQVLVLKSRAKRIAEKNIDPETLFTNNLYSSKKEFAEQHKQLVAEMEEAVITLSTMLQITTSMLNDGN